MSEKVRHSPEHKSEHLDVSAEIEKNLKRAEKAAEAADKHAVDTAEVRSHVEQQAVSGKEISVGEKESPKQAEFGVYKEMKGQTYKRTLNRVRQQLPAPERAMSKVMHQKQVEVVSEVMGKTVARPSGILGGGIVALLGSSFLLFMAKRYGFEYNFALFFALIAGGFLLGLTSEICIRLILRARR